MNAPLMPGDHWILVGVLAAEGAVIVGLAALVARRTKAGAGRRTVWQATLLALAAALVVEITGVGRGMAGWVRQTLAASRPPPPEPRAVPFVPAPVDVVPLNVSKNTKGLVEPDRPPPLVPSPKVVPPAERITRWPAAIWLIGFGVLAGKMGFRRVRFALECRGQRPHSDAQLAEQARSLAQALGLSRTVRLLESTKCLGPVAFGLGRPTVALPPCFTAQFTPAQQAAMLAHELAHLAARDPAWYLLADLVSAALWWHPLAWWARRQLHAASEVAADEASLLVTNGPAALAESLVKLGGQMTEPKSAGGLGIEGFRSGLGRRVERLLQLDGRTWRAPNRLKSFLARTLGPLALALMAVLCTAWAWPQSMLASETPFSRLRESWRGMMAAVAPSAKAVDQKDRSQQLLAPTTDRLVVATAAAVTSSPPARVAIEVRIAELTGPAAGHLQFEPFLNSLRTGGPSNALTSVKAVLTVPQSRMILNALGQRDHTRLSTAESVIATNGVLANIPLPANTRHLVNSFAVVPIVWANNVEIDLGVVSNVPQVLLDFGSHRPAQGPLPLTALIPIPRTWQQTHAEVWDGQTLMIGGTVEEGHDNRLAPFRSQTANPGQTQFLLFITATVVDENGKRVHTENELPFANNTVPPQSPQPKEAPGRLFVDLLEAPDALPDDPQTPLLYPTLPPKLVTGPQSNLKEDGNSSVPLPPLLYPTKPLRPVPVADAAAGMTQPPVIPFSPLSTFAPIVVLTPSGSQQTNANAGRTTQVEKAKKDLADEDKPSPGASQHPADKGDSLQRQMDDAKLLYEMRRLDQAEAKCREVLALDPGNIKARYYLDLILKAQAEEFLKKEKPASITIPSENQRRNTEPKRTIEVERAWQLPRDRDSQPSRNPYIRTNVPNTSTKQRQALLAKMEQVHFVELHFDGLPLSEVVKFLADECRKQDPAKKGLNFILNPFIESAPPVPQLAPGTPPPPPRKIDMMNVIIKIKPALQDLTLLQALDVVCKMADQPIQFIVEDYAIVFTPKQDLPPQLYTRTFKVDPNTFLQGLQSVTGVPLTGSAANNQGGRASSNPAVPRVQTAPGGQSPGGVSSVTRTNGSETASQAVRQSLALLGLKAGTNAAAAGAPQVLFNDRTGVLVVRATVQDLEIIEHAMEVLNTAPQQIALDVQLTEVTHQDAVRLGFAQFLGTLPGVSYQQKDAYLRGTNQIAVNTNTNKKAGAPSAKSPSAALSSPSAAAAMIGGATAGILKPAEFKAVLQAFERSDDTKLRQFHRLTTLSGRGWQAQVQAVELMTVVTGVKRGKDGLEVEKQSVPMGPVLDVFPSVGADGFSIQMTLIPTITEFLGYDDPGRDLPKEILEALEKDDLKAGLPLPRMRTRQSKTSAVLWDGQTILLGMPSSLSATNQKSLVFFVTPTIVDPAGNRVHTDEELSQRHSTPPKQPARAPAK